MTGFSITPLGVGDAFSVRYYSSCLLVEFGEKRLLVDCPHPIRKILHEATSGRVDIGDIDAVVLTHLHADHVSGLEDFAFFSWFVLQKRVTLLCCEAVRERLWDDCLAAGMDQLFHVDRGELVSHRFEEYFDWIPLDLGQPVSFGPFAIASRLTRHHIPTTALRIRAGEREVGYSADTGYDPDLLDWLAPSDLVIHEVNLGAHTPLEKLLDLPHALRSKMRLIHYLDDHDLEDTRIAPLIQGQPVHIA